MSDAKTFLKEMFINEAKPALNRYSGGGDGLIEVSELPEVGEENMVYKLVSGATPIPTSGTVGTVYFNTSLSNDEIDAIVDRYAIYTNDEVDTLNGVNFNIIAVSDTNLYLGLFKISEARIIAIVDETFNLASQNAVMFYFNDSGWDTRLIPYDLNWTLIQPTNMTVGRENDKLTNLISLANKFGSSEPEYYIYEGSTPTQVPNEGMVEKIYFNTSLTKDEVHNILSGLNFLDAGSPFGDLIYFPFVNADYSCNIQISYYPSTNEYHMGYAIDGTMLNVFDSTNHELENGWDNSLFIEAYNVNSENIASSILAQFGGEMQNEKLANLINTTPFGSKWTKISGSEPNLQAKEATANGEVVADSGYDGLSKVTVNVEGGLEPFKPYFKLEKFTLTNTSGTYAQCDYNGNDRTCWRDMYFVAAKENSPFMGTMATIFLDLSSLGFSGVPKKYGYTYLNSCRQTEDTTNVTPLNSTETFTVNASKVGLYLEVEFTDEDLLMLQGLQKYMRIDFAIRLEYSARGEQGQCIIVVETYGGRDSEEDVWTTYSYDNPLTLALNSFIKSIELYLPQF